MGCDIHIFAEKKQNGKWIKVEEDVFSLDQYDQKITGKTKGSIPFDWRSYSLFAFLAGVRNYDCCEPISEPKGLPNDSEYLNQEVDDGWGGKTSNLKETQENCYHSYSWLTLKELLDFDYDKTFWNRRVSKQTGPNSWNGASLAEEGEGSIVSQRENLGGWFFKHLEEMKQIGEPENVRIVFWFDN